MPDTTTKRKTKNNNWSFHYWANFSALRLGAEWNIGKGFADIVLYFLFWNIGIFYYNKEKLDGIPN